MNSYYVYILRCHDGSYYIGVTSDIDGRYLQHQEGLIKNCYTHSRRPVQLMYGEETNDVGAAIYREKQLKRWSRKKKEALIQGDEKALTKLARGRKGYMKRKVILPLSPRA